jgi:sugar lactone lactonase YvrE
VKVAITTGIVVILAAGGITGYLLWPHSPGSQTRTGHPAPPSGQTGQPAAPAWPTVLPFTDLNEPWGVAVDTAGNVYITEAAEAGVNNTGNNRVLKLPAGSNTPVELPFTGLTSPGGVAVDSAGNVYVADWSNNRVLKLPAQ